MECDTADGGILNHITHLTQNLTRSFLIYLIHCHSCPTFHCLMSPMMKNWKTNPSLLQLPNVLNPLIPCLP